MSDYQLLEDSATCNRDVLQMHLTNLTERNVFILHSYEIQICLITPKIVNSLESTCILDFHVIIHNLKCSRSKKILAQNAVSH
jgi:hypothetical protein